MNEKGTSILTIILAITILVMGIGAIIYDGLDLEFNGGKCQVCGEDVIPVGHQFSTDYYCPNCHRYNEG